MHQIPADVRPVSGDLSRDPFLTRPYEVTDAPIEHLQGVGCRLSIAVSLS